MLAEDEAGGADPALPMGGLYPFLFVLWIVGLAMPSAAAWTRTIRPRPTSSP